MTCDLANYMLSFFWIAEQDYTFQFYSLVDGLMLWFQIDEILKFQLRMRIIAKPDGKWRQKNYIFCWLVTSPTMYLKSIALCTDHKRMKKIESYSVPVITGRFRNVFKTSFVCYGCLKDVSQTACVYWDWSLLTQTTFSYESKNKWLHLHEKKRKH